MKLRELEWLDLIQAKKGKGLAAGRGVMLFPTYFPLLLSVGLYQHSSRIGHPFMATPETPAGQWTVDIPYAHDNFLQTYDVFPTTNNGPWVVLIHGGFFRDPRVLAKSLHATVEQLQTNYNSLSSRVAGYATLNYRLSKHPEYPQDSETTDFQLRNASWPQHLDDVMQGLSQLQNTYGFGTNYILAGHSVGAQLALLTALKASKHGIVAPKVIVGKSGVYDFPLLHQVYPDYKALTFNAMREGEELDTSPALYAAEEYEKAGVQKVVLAHSRDDGLVGWDQVERMQEVLRESQAGKGYVTVVELYGAHNNIWEDGKESARAISVALEGLLPT